MAKAFGNCLCVDIPYFYLYECVCMCVGITLRVRYESTWEIHGDIHVGVIALFLVIFGSKLNSIYPDIKRLITVGLGSICILSEITKF